MRSYARTALALTATVALAAPLLSCAKEEGAGVLLVLNTDAPVPDGIDAIGLVVADARTNVPIQPTVFTRPLGGRTSLPGTLLLETAFDEPTFGRSTTRKLDTVQIALVGLRHEASGGKVVVLRRATVTMPRDGVRVLRLGLSGLDLGSATVKEGGTASETAFATNWTSIRSNCPEGATQDRVFGGCRPIPVYGEDALPLLATVPEAQNPAAQACFGPTESVFAGVTPRLVQTRAECVVNVPGAAKVAVALQRQGKVTPLPYIAPGAAADLPTPPYTFANGAVTLDGELCTTLLASPAEILVAEGRDPYLPGAPYCSAEDVGPPSDVSPGSETVYALATKPAKEGVYAYGADPSPRATGDRVAFFVNGTGPSEPSNVTHVPAARTRSFVWGDGAGVLFNGEKAYRVAANVPSELPTPPAIGTLTGAAIVDTQNATDVAAAWSASSVFLDTGGGQTLPIANVVGAATTLGVPYALSRDGVLSALFKDGPTTEVARGRQFAALTATPRGLYAVEQSAVGMVVHYSPPNPLSFRESKTGTAPATGLHAAVVSTATVDVVFTSSTTGVAFQVWKGGAATKSGELPLGGAPTALAAGRGANDKQCVYIGYSNAKIQRVCLR